MKMELKDKMGVNMSWALDATGNHKLIMRYDDTNIKPNIEKYHRKYWQNKFLLKLKGDLIKF